MHTRGPLDQPGEEGGPAARTEFLLGQSQRICAAERPRDRFARSLQSARRPVGLRSREPSCRPTDFFCDCQLARHAASAIPDCSLQELRRKNHHRIALGAVQSEAGREQSRAGAAARRAHRADGRLLEHGCRRADLARIHLHRSQPARLHRLRAGLPKSQLPGPGRRRSERRNCRSGIP